MKQSLGLHSGFTLGVLRASVSGVFVFSWVHGVFLSGGTRVVKELSWPRPVTSRFRCRPD